MGAVEIAGALAASRRAVRLYPPEHPTHREAITELLAAVTDSIDIRPVVLNLREGRLYEGSEVITEASAATRALAEAMEIRRVESMTFHMGFNEVDAEGLSEVLSLRPSPDLQLEPELETRGVRGVTLSELEDNTSAEAEERDRRREADRSLYRQTLGTLDRAITSLADSESDTVESLEITRSIVAMLERITEDPHAIISLAMMTGHGEHWKFHAVGTMLYSLVLGVSLGLSDRLLLSVGLAGLLHDTGSIVPAPGGAVRERAEHPIAGAHTLGALVDDDNAAMIVAFEHHMGLDGSGWPPRHPEYVLHPFSRIVAIADRYDNLIRPAEGSGLRPDEAVTQLLREASDGPLDPLLTRLFVEKLGVMPVGSIVRLSDHSIGIIRMPGVDPLRPHLRLVLDGSGAELRPTRDIDLTEDERAISAMIHADILGLQSSDYL